MSRHACPICGDEHGTYDVMERDVWPVYRDTDTYEISFPNKLVHITSRDGGRTWQGENGSRMSGNHCQTFATAEEAKAYIRSELQERIDEYNEDIDLVKQQLAAYEG